MYFGALFVADFYQDHNFLEDDYLDIAEVKVFFENYKGESKSISFEDENNTTKAIFALLNRRNSDISEVMKQIRFFD